ncbi:hypothetical protein OAD98_00095 [Flavobacteriales bacterium]|nr:hypothetical protein [Flavobacteriales bacterium]
MDKTPLYFLFIAALFGGILCDRYVGTSLPFFTVVFLLVAGIIYFTVTKKVSDEEE